MTPFERSIWDRVRVPQGPSKGPRRKYLALCLQKWLQNGRILRHKSDLTQKLKTVLSSRRELTLDCRKGFQNGGFFDDGAGEVHRTFFFGFLMVTLDDGGHQRAFQGAWRSSSRGGEDGVNYGNEPGAKQIAIWRTGCKSKFPEPMCRNAAFWHFR